MPATSLKMVARAGVGIDNVDVDYASSKGVIVVNAPFGNTNSAAEHTMALLLSFCRNVTKANASLKSGEWKRAPFTGYELKGKTAGVIGLGKVGGRVATRLKAFECEVLACDPVHLPSNGPMTWVSSWSPTTRSTKTATSSPSTPRSTTRPAT